MPLREDDREVEWSEELDILPDRSADDSDSGWGEPRPAARRRARDQQLLDERPPHWE
ncbi:MAG TPA: hypothetical protein VE172_08795 [Stackebrandtia sp.]|uniref:hypothetical protein n=1 Tax=Stackebrandtia sp. TaxID=2023065 RepID=UPI002D4F4BFD|nr:hypothetical protein [Stackebrandtia sp.]HZE38893.1 hypothetical protein [Stackebrandtia sp.]